MTRYLGALAILMAGAARAAPVPVTPEARPVTVGALHLDVLHDADFAVPNDGKTFGTDVGPQAVARVLTAAGAPTDTIHLSVDALLVRLPGRIVLIDTGLGPKTGGVLLGSLAAAGVTPAQVTDVLITHSHGDHVGGLIGKDGKPAFPLARIRMAAKEWAFLRSKPEMAALVAAIAPQVVPFEPGTSPVPGIVSIALPGHTPGHTGYRIASGKAEIVDIGDSAHSSIVSLAKPGWSIKFDTDDAAAKANRATILARLAAAHTLVFAPHFPFPGIGYVVKAGDGYAWSPTVH